MLDELKSNHAGRKRFHHFYFLDVKKMRYLKKMEDEKMKSYNPVTQAIVAELVKIVGEKNVSVDPDKLHP